MRYYLNTAQQNKTEEGYVDYGKKETKGTGEAARLNAISELHSTYATMIKTEKTQYWMGKVEDGKGNVLDKLETGEYIDVDAAPTEVTGE